MVAFSLKVWCIQDECSVDCIHPSRMRISESVNKSISWNACIHRLILQRQGVWKAASSG